MLAVAIGSLFFLFVDLGSWIILDSWVMRGLLVFTAATIARENNVIPSLALIFLEGMLVYDNVLLSGIFTFLFAVGAQQLNVWLFVDKKAATYFLVAWGILIESSMLFWGTPFTAAVRVTLWRSAVAIVTTAIVNYWYKAPKTN